ncbi:hypothetical protein BKA62DRAFT_676359 [Auriculariales sp. MPI-PUGE-AT-0066]|nr:hypothetical protein BKA62DRAFT_676359 [Auriculariales sp. MPI-PUGE-AT-0066]
MRVPQEHLMCARCMPVKDVPWVTEVFRGFGGNPEIVGLLPKGRSVRCAIEAHRARGRRSPESGVKMKSEDRGQGTSVVVGQVQVEDRDKPIVDYELWKLVSGSARRVSMEHMYGSTGVQAMMAGAQPEGLAMYQVKVRDIGGAQRPGQESDTYRSISEYIGERTGVFGKGLEI